MCAIYSATRRCFHDDEFRNLCRFCSNPYGQGNAGKKIAEVLASVPLDQKLLRKRMTLKGEVMDGWYR